MNYESVADFSALWGLLYFFAMFVCVLVYALWPRNQGTFDHAAQMPLREDDLND